MGRHRKRRTSSSSDKSNGATNGRYRNHAAQGDAAYDGTEGQSTMKRLFGFEMDDFPSWSKFVQLHMRPTDPAGLAVVRIAFGLLMAIDIPQERGLGYADYRWGDPDECRFPLFNFLKVLPIQWMYVVYLAMFCAAIGLMLGFLYRLSCLVFVLTYWYIFLLDKTTWNNHSYLYGLCGILFLFTDANRYWSIDGLIMKRTQNTHVPLWNYGLFRAQIFLVYFIAGVKKLDHDWVSGYSMNELSKHWVFLPFTNFLTHEQIDLYIVHWGGLFIDLFMGYFLFFDFTRPLGFLIGLSFHAMNSQIFSIGMFPYTMIATMPLFCAADWPKRLLSYLPQRLHTALPALSAPDASSACLYQKHQIKPEPSQYNGGDERRSRRSPDCIYDSAVARDKPTLRHQLSAIGVVLYLLTQCFLPYSHFLTKGYNNWTNGLYGYSWDMMVHSWSTQHIRITYVDQDVGDVGFLNPDAWTKSKWRWSAHADMAKQYAMCIQQRLREHNITNLELYFDVWRSLNDRFQQRIFDPRVDLVTAEWHPFRKTPWLMPLLTELSDWREQLDRIERSIYNSSADMDVVFIADFPGLSLENYIQEDLQETEISVLQGSVIVELVDRNENHSLADGESMQVPPGEYHNVHTVSETPSCYMYKFVNTTERDLAKNLTAYETKKAAQNASNNGQDSVSTESGDHESPSGESGGDVSGGESDELDPALAAVYDQVKQEQERLASKTNRTMWERFEKLTKDKYQLFYRSALLTRVALKSIYSGKPFVEVFNDTIGMHDDITLEI